MTDRIKLESDWAKEIRSSVIDERVWPEVVRVRQVSLEDLVSDQDSQGIKKLKGEVAQSIIEKKDILSSITASLEEVTAMRKSLQRQAPDTLFHPQSSPDTIRKALEEIKRSDPTYILLKLIETDISNGRTHSDAIEVVKGGLRLHYLKKIGKGQVKGRILIFDADASKRLNERIFQRNFEYREIKVPRHLEVLQVSDRTFSRVSLFPLAKASGEEKRQRKMSRFGYEVFEYLRTVATPETLVVSYKELADLLRETRQPGDDLGGVEHFGALRGIDEHKGRETVIVVGRNQPSDRDLASYARCFYGQDQDPLVFRPSLEPGQMPTGPEPDERIQELLEQIREAESMQALARLRDVQSDTPKKVILLSSLPLPGLEIESVTWKELREEAGIERKRSPEKEAKRTLARKLKAEGQTVGEIAVAVGVSDRTIQRWINT